jgi:hypothetical protein
MSDKSYLLPAILIGSDPASQIHATSRISVGVGDAKLTKDGETIWEEDKTSDYSYDDCMSVAEAEELAKADPDHDWRIVIYGALSGRTYQRHGDMQWVLVEKNLGFA